MARGKTFNKRAGGPRLDAENEEEIAIRNARMEELEEQRATRRAEEEEDGDDKEGGGGEEKEKKTEEETPAQTERKKKDAALAPVVPVTTEADHKRNLAKLAHVRKRREEAETKRKQEEQVEKELEEETKKMIERVTRGDDEDEETTKKSKSSKNVIPKLDKIAIKKMKPAQMKESMKERGLDIQGNAKVLLQRLLDFEASRS